MGVAVCRPQEYREVFPSMDGAPGIVADGPSNGRLWNRGGCQTVQRVQMPFGTSVSGVQGPVSPSGGGGRASPIVILRDPRYGCRAADESPHIDSEVGSIPGGGAWGVFSSQCVFPGADGPPLCFIRQWSHDPGDDPALEHSPDIQIHAPVCPEVAIVWRQCWIPVLRPPPGFETFSWPWEEWVTDGKASLFDFSQELPSCFFWRYRGQSVGPPSLPISPVLRDSLDDSFAANVGSSREESNSTSAAVAVAPAVVNTLPVGIISGPDVVVDLSSPGPVSGSPVDAIADFASRVTGRAGCPSPAFVLRWRLAREGPFLAERSSSSIRCLGPGCAFRNTTYRPLDYALPSGRVWSSHAPSPIPGVDWHPGDGRPVGNGSWTVAAFINSGPGYTCGCTAP